MNHDRTGVLLPMPFGRLVALLLVLIWSAPIFAIPASPHPFNATQPDGTAISLYVRGDEYNHWWEDLDGYMVVLDDADNYVYAAPDAQASPTPTKWLVGSVNPQDVGLTRGLRPDFKPRPNETQFRSGTADGETAQAPQASTGGIVKNLVIILQFADHAARVLPLQPTYDAIFNAVGGDPSAAPTGSVRDVYLEDSYGQFTIDSTVFGWYLLPQTEAFYAGGSSGLGVPKTYIVDALNLADADIDFSQFDEDGSGFVDSIAFLHSGYGAEFGGTDVDGAAQGDRIWSHRSGIPVWTSDEGVKVSGYHISAGLWGTSGSGPSRIGVICHEAGHFFGLPDLYDTNGGGSGIGSYGMMANSWGFDGSQYFPPHFSPWSKIRLGWETATVISAPGVYALPQAETNPAVFRIDGGYPNNEYLLIENRQPVGHDAAMPQGGLAIWHIDESTSYSNEGYPGQIGWPENGRHYRVALLQADGDYDLERGFGRGDGGDVYHGGVDGVDALNAATRPNTNAYQNGNIQVLGHSIWEISQASSTMTFRLGGLPPEAAEPPFDFLKNRFVSFSPGNEGASVAIRVELTDRACSDTGKKCASDVNCLACVGGENDTAGCSIDSQCAGGVCTPSAETCDDLTPPVMLGWVDVPFEPTTDRTPPGLQTSTVVAAQPAARSWPEQTVHLGDCEIAPVHTYALSTTTDGVSFSERFHVQTIEKPDDKFWADIVGGFDGVAWSPANLIVGVDDVSAILKFLTLKPAPHITRVDLAGSAPTYTNFIINASDLGLVLQGFTGKTYPPIPYTVDGYPADGDVTNCP